MATDNSTDDSAHQITRRVLLRLAWATPVAAGLGALPALPAVAQPHPVQARTSRLLLGDDNLRRIDLELHRRDLPNALAELPGERPQTDDLTDLATELEVYASDEIPTDTFRVAGFTWEGDQPSDTALLIRTRGRGRGEWSEWVRLHDDDHGPDPDSAEAATARRGTDALIVDEADAVEVRVESPDGVVPSGLAVELIDPDESPADADVGQAGASPQAEPHRPAIRTRADWGADESMRGGPEYAEVRGMFVHHTAGSNSYSSGDVPGIIRSIYAYHVNGRGWRDIGYNFLIDKFGGIWEGRYGGMDRAVIGAHTLGYNTYAFAASVLGTYVNNEPSDATLRAYERLIAWKFDLHEVNASSTVSYPGLKTLPAISGHRDGAATECPGDQLYAKLGTIRNGASGPPLGSQLRLTAHTTAARAGKRIWFDIEWNAGSTPVSGRVQLQRRSGDRWVSLRKSTIRNGFGVTYAYPLADRTYRLVSGESTDPANVAKITAGTLSIDVEQSESDLTMTRAGATRPDGEVPIDIDWRFGSSGVTGRVELQYFRNGSWHRARESAVTDGVGTTALRPSRSQVYRLRALRADSPSNAPTGHPVGTSNEFRVVV